MCNNFGTPLSQNYTASKVGGTRVEPPGLAASSLVVNDTPWWTRHLFFSFVIECVPPDIRFLIISPTLILILIESDCSLIAFVYWSVVATTSPSQP